MKPLIVLSQDPTPARAEYLKELTEELTRRSDLAVLVVPCIYDLEPHHASLQILIREPGPLLVAAWFQPRAIEWILRSKGVREMAEILPLFLEPFQSPSTAANELERRYREFQIDSLESDEPAIPGVQSIAESVSNKWYPVIDSSRCSHCGQCLDFCLFGVYGRDESNQVTVVQPDACKNGCPACARVCPQGAIVFPRYGYDAAIAGDPEAKPPTAQAAERRAMLDRAQSMKNEQSRKTSATAPTASGDSKTSPPEKAKDDLDQLIDALDDLERL